ncbi:trimethylamine methyltransferase family protein [Ruminococcus sp. OA3]|uniref:trimethylamine methyltransferase family protein n=1 Tax=Ruminococcus sp. OA3 TaxID=2914164 RepID=UPI001F05823C|nr:trimethylamine methyltransferase family protein [Ruminococcus sp. OA3]MCH1981244.1 trimethylamine methyltransferase family protein [Ruminococcus sp. OA3]
MSREQMIHNAAMEIMRDVGVNIHNEKAIEIYRANGIKVEGNTAYFTEEQVMHWVKMAPESFTLHARNPKYDMVIGGNHTNPAPTYGCAFIDDWEGKRRRGTMEDFIKCLKLVHAEDSYSINGGIMIQPGDIPEEAGAIQMFYATLLHSDKAIMLPTGFKDEMALMLEAGCELFGGKEGMIEKPRMIALINTVSPLSLDERMLDCLMLLAEYGQAAILCPAAMLGATGSLSMAGTLASGAAESLAGIVLAQMIRPGAPVVFGVQSTAADMRGGITFACAAPEGTLMQGFGANLARFYGLPSRGGGCQTDAPVINCQAGYESMLTFSSAYRHGINFVMEAGGVMDSVNATSFEKMIIDFEIIRQVKAAFTPIEVTEETLNLEEIKEIGHDGSFVTSDYTLDNFEDLYSPHIGERNAKGSDYFKNSIEREMHRLLKTYDENRPELDVDMRDKVKAVLSKSGLEMKYLENIEQ